MNIRWILQKDVFDDDDFSKLITSLEKAEIKHEVVGANAYLIMNSTKEECVVSYGSLNQASNLIRTKPNWIPGAYYNNAAYRCEQYYPFLGDLIVNGHYRMLPFGELLRCQSQIYQEFGVGDELFVRPSTGGKCFSGTLLNFDDYQNYIEILKDGGIGPAELVVVSSPKRILKEWRFVIVDGKVVTGSQYMDCGKVSVSSGVDPAAKDVAIKAAKRYSPDKAWTVDVCSTPNDEYKVLEIGCFSCSALYACDADIVVESVSEVAYREWEDYMESICPDLEYDRY